VSYFTVIASNLTTTVYLDTNLVNGATYYYVVSAANANGESDDSAQAIATPNGGYSQVVLDDTPWGYWKLNEIVGATAFDSSTKGFNGTYAAGVSIGGLGPDSPFNGFVASNNAAYFQGLTTSYVSLPALNLNSANVTFTAWIYPTAATQTGATGLIFWRDSGGHSSGFGYANNGLDLAYNWNDDSSLWPYDSGLNPPINQWSFVALVVTSTNATLYLYNNSEQLSVTNVHSQAPAAFSGTVRIGSDSLNSGVRNFNGGICQVAIFKSSLNQNQINQLYNGATGVLPNPLAANLTIGNLNGNTQLKWSAGTLLEATNLAGPWTTNPAASPLTMPATTAQKFYRVRLQ
jgi:Concanavalin A-like lectin/glucanases superfamily